MHGLLKRPGDRAPRARQLEAGACSPKQGLGTADLEWVLAPSNAPRAPRVRSIVAINEDGVFGTSRAGWRPTRSLLGRVTQGSTARCLDNGILPGDGSVHRRPDRQLSE
jgi:hypothetical protein